MAESLGTITLVEPTRLPLGSRERVVVEYANQNDDVTHHIKTAPSTSGVGTPGCTPSPDEHQSIQR